MAIYTTYVSSSGAGAHTDIGGSITGSLFIQGEANSPHTGKLVVNTISGSMTDMFPGLVISGSTGAPGDLGRIIMSGTVEFEHKLEIRDAITSNSSLHMSSSDGLFDVSAHPSPVSEGVKFRLSNSSNVISNNYILGQIQFAATKDTDGPRGVAASILARAPEGYDGSMHSTGVPADLEFYADDLATPKLFVSSSGRVGIGTAAPATKLHVDGVTRSVTSVQTPLIEYTDGDDAIVIADGGYVSFPQGLAQSNAVQTAEFDTASWEWCKIATIPAAAAGGLPANSVSEATILVNPVGYANLLGEERGTSTYTITVRVTTDAGGNVYTYMHNSTFVMVDVSRLNTTDNFLADRDVTLNYKSDGTVADLWIRVPMKSGTTNWYGQVFTTMLGGTDTSDDEQHAGPPWTLVRDGTPQDDAPTTNSFLYGAYPSKHLDVITGSIMHFSSSAGYDAGGEGATFTMEVKNTGDTGFQHAKGVLWMTGSEATILGFSGKGSSASQPSFITKMQGTYSLAPSMMEEAGGLALTGSGGGFDPRESSVWMCGDGRSRVIIAAGDVNGDNDASLIFAVKRNAGGYQEAAWGIHADDSRDDRLIINPGAVSPDNTSEFLGFKAAGPNMQSHYVRNALADVGSPANYFIYLNNMSDSDGQGSGIAFSSDDAGAVTDNTNVGAAIIHKRVGNESKGSLEFYTKQSTVAGAAPVLAMEIDEGGKLHVDYGIQIDGGAIYQSDGVAIIEFNQTGEIAGIAPILDDLYISSSAASTKPILRLESRDTTTTDAAEIRFQHGPQGSTINGGGINLGEIKFQGAEDAGIGAPPIYGTGASIQGVSDGAWGTNDRPGRLEFYTTADGTTGGVERLRIAANGLATFTNDVEVGASLKVGGGFGSTGLTILSTGAINMDGTLKVASNEILDSGGNNAFTFDGANNTVSVGTGVTPSATYGFKAAGIYSTADITCGDDLFVYGDNGSLFVPIKLHTDGGNAGNIDLYNGSTTVRVHLDASGTSYWSSGQRISIGESTAGSTALWVTDNNNGTSASAYMVAFENTHEDPADARRIMNFRFTDATADLDNDDYCIRAHSNSTGTLEWYIRWDGTNNLPFTGQHWVVFVADTDSVNAIGNMSSELEPGMIVQSTGDVWLRRNTQDNFVKVKKTAVTKSKTVYGVMADDYSSGIDLGYWNDYSGTMNSASAVPEGGETDDPLNYSSSSVEFKCRVNSIGEGAIWVTNISGDVENGDYITSSEIAGYGQLQDDDLLHNYTVAKCTESIDWDNVTDTINHEGQAFKRYLTGCTYHCG